MLFVARTYARTYVLTFVCTVGIRIRLQRRLNAASALVLALPDWMRPLLTA